jgi:phospholipase/carboxylesterase
VIPAACTVDAARQLEALGANVTADLIPQLGHGIDDRVVDHIIKRLREKAAARN